MHKIECSFKKLDIVILICTIELYKKEKKRLK